MTCEIVNHIITQWVTFTREGGVPTRYSDDTCMRESLYTYLRHKYSKNAGHVVQTLLYAKTEFACVCLVESGFETRIECYADSDSINFIIATFGKQDFIEAAVTRIK